MQTRRFAASFEDLNSCLAQSPGELRGAKWCKNHCSHRIKR